MEQYKNLNKLCQEKLKKTNFKEFEEKVAIIAIKSSKKLKTS